MTAYIGPIGGLVPLKCPASLALEDAAPLSTTVTTGGRRVAFLGKESRRTWNVDATAADPGEATRVQALRAGVFGPPPWHWVDPWAQVSNVLTPGASSFAAGTFWGGGGPSLSDAPVDLGGGVVARRSILVPTTSPVAVTGAPGSRYAPVPVLPGVPVTASFYGTVAEPEAYLRIGFRDAAGVDIATHSAYSTASVGGTERMTLTVTPGVHAASLWVGAAKFSRIACPQVTWTPYPVPWAYGQGASQVVIDQIGVSALRAVRTSPTQRVGANTFQLVEVG